MILIIRNQKVMEKENSKFYVVATPIGNLKDFSFRAVEVLSSVDSILCEDTRETQKLLNAYDIKKPTYSYHAQSSQKREDFIIQKIQEGETFALVSDAGTPTISDPGVKIISRIRKEFPEIQIIPIPGATAFVSALSVTGFKGGQFTFYGFLPHKKGRKKIFEEIANSEKISVFYESPHRLLKTLTELTESLDDKKEVCVAREITKIFEETRIMKPQEMLDFFKENPEKIKGEFVIIINS